MDIEKQLEILGLSDKEVKTYLSLLQLGSSNAHKIAKEADLERTTIYKILDQLVEKGLAMKNLVGKRQHYTAEPISALELFFDKKKSALDLALPFLGAMQGNKSNKPTVRYYDTADGMRKVITETLNAKEKLRRDMAFVDNVVDLFGQRFVRNHVDQRVKKKIHVQSLRRDPKVSKLAKDWYLTKDNKKMLREIRYLDAKFKFEPFIMTYDHRVNIFSSTKEHFALVIESAEFAQAMKTLFDIAWSIATPAKKG